VDRWPGLLRVRLYTRRHDRVAARSRIALARGEGDFAHYEGALERRGRNGIGFGLAGDYLNTAPSSDSRDYRNTQLWLQGGYVPSGRFGVQFQLQRSRPLRVPVTSGFGDLSSGFQATRTDAQFRVALRRRNDGLGLGADVLYARTSWESAEDEVPNLGIDQQVNQLGGVVSFRSPTFSGTLSGFHRTRWTSLDARASLAWAPAGFLSLSAEGTEQRHDGDRKSEWAGVRAGLRLPYGFMLTGAARVGQVVAAPAIAADQAQDISDLQGTLGFESARIGFEVGAATTAAWQPFAYQQFPLIESIGASPRTDWITASGRIAALKWMTFEGWYSSPRTGSREGQPPRHMLGTATIRTQFLRRFPSGALEVKLQLGVENWSDGVIGRDGSGQPIQLQQATFFRGSAEVRLQSLIFYFDRRNLTSVRTGYVPGIPIPALVTNFGIRWEFMN
jgi:hypothetical protein